MAYTPEEVGNAVAGFAKHVVDTYGQEGKNIVGYRQVVGDQYDNSGKGGVPGHCRTDNPIWSPSSYTWNSEYIYFDCSSFATGCYHYVAGVIDSPHATGSLMGSPSDMSGKFEKIHWDKSQSSLKNGDLMFYDGHAWIYSGDGKTSENGRYHCNWDYHNGQDIYIYRITSAGASAITTLNTEFSVAGTSNNGSGIAAEKINYSNFFFNGIPDGKYSLASRESIFTIIINSLKELVNYFTGLITYLLRGFIIGIISVFDRLINNTIESVSNSPKTLKETGVKATNADDPISMDRSVTIEGLIFGEVDLFDINIFKVD
ncbi:MAG: C40 family peptidase [Clostridia bacterium]|nr:C40 family peptidase [Clostridia bacterium]